MSAHKDTNLTTKIQSFLGGLITLVVVSLVLFFNQTPVYALEYNINSNSDWNKGKFNNTESYSSFGDIRIKSLGSWGPLSWRTPAISSSAGTTIVSDGSYIYMLDRDETSFSRYIPSENRWENLSRSPYSTGYGADLTVLGDYIYAIFGGYSKKFARYSISNNSWEELSEMPDLARYGSSLASDGTFVYALRGNITSDFWKYDPSSDSWIVLSNTPATIYQGASLVYDNGYLYTPRGYNQRTFYRYDISAGTWSTRADSPVAFYEHTNADIVDGYIYILRDNGSNSLYRYNISANSWTTLTNTPQLTRYVGLVYNQSDDVIYVFRGNGTYDFWKYDYENNQFLGPADLPNTPGTGSDLIYHSGNVYMPRGNNSNLFYRYVVATNLWESRTNAPFNFNDDTKGELVGDDIYFFVGNNTLTFYKYNISSNSWTQLTDALATVRYGGSLSYPGTGDYIYATRGNFSRTFWRYSISGNSWDDISVTDIPLDGAASYGARLVSDGTDIYYLSGSRTSTLFKYDISENSWTEISDLPYAPYYGTDAYYYNGNIYVLAGYYKDEFWEYNISGDTWRKLDPVQYFYGYDYGAYNGASIEGDDSGHIYMTWGGNRTSFNYYTIGSNKYNSTGTWISESIDLNYVSSWNDLTISSTTSGDSSVSVYSRTSADKINWSSWEQVVDESISSSVNRYIELKLVLNSSTDGNTSSVVHSITLDYNSDNQSPTNISNIKAYSQEVGGALLTSGSSYSHAHPYFTWDAGSDAQTQVLGYYVYFGSSSSADPVVSGYFQTSNDFVVTTPLTVGTYYLRVKTVDTSENKSTALSAFDYVYSGVSSTSFPVSESTVFNQGTLDNVNTSGDEIKLVSKDGFWLQDRVSTSPANLYRGSDSVYVSSLNKIYVLRANNTNAFYSHNLDDGTWTTLATTPSTVNYGGSITKGLDGYLYAFRGNNTSSFWRYNIATNEWSDAEATDPPQPIYYGGSLVSDGDQYIYALRGNNDDAFSKYDMVEDTWTTLSSVEFGAPSRQPNNYVYYGGDLTMAGSNSIYAIQGYLRTGFSVYSINEDSWTVLGELPFGAGPGANIEYDEESHSIFYNPGNYKPYLFKYDINSETWTQLDNAPNYFYYGASMENVDSTLYMFRGNNSNIAYKYNIQKSSWLTPTTDIFGPFYFGTDYRSFSNGAAIVKGDGDYLYLIRGYSDNLFARYNTQNGESTLLRGAPASFYNGASLAYENTNNKIYATASDFSRRFYSYDISSDSWTEIQTDPLPTTPNYGSTLAYDGSQYIYWLRGSNSNTFYRYNIQGTPTSRWESLTNAPATIGYGAEFVFKGGYLYTVRGANYDNNPLYRYNPSQNSWATLSSVPGRISNDGFLVDGGDDTLYACRATNTSDCWKYTISTDDWEIIASPPANLTTGGAAAFDGSNKLFVIAGAGTNTYNNGLYTYVMQTESSSFEEEGSYISASHDLSNVYRFANITLNYTDANNADFDLYTRTSQDLSEWSSWSEATEELINGTSYSYKINSPSDRYIQVKINMESGDGIYSGVVKDYTINYYQDSQAPLNPSTFSSYSDDSEVTSITTNTWSNYANPYFDWPDAEESGGASDLSSGSGSGVIGYYVYFGTNPMANPESLGTLTALSEYSPSSLVSGETYYLRIKTVDDAGNVSTETWQPFVYKFDNVSPTSPSDLSSTPSGYSFVDNFSFSWDPSTDASSQVSEYCYKTGATSGDFSVDQCTSVTTVSDITSYKSASNTFYVRAKDNAGNYSEYSTVSYYYSSTAPSPPTDLTVYPEESTENSFEFSWDTPEVYFGSEGGLQYFYSINSLPTSSSVVRAYAKSLDAGAYATLPGENTLYVVAKDESGNINYQNYASVTFSANTTAPGIPTQVDIADVSVKSTQSWKLALSWELPLSQGAGVSTYRIYRSSDGDSFSQVASTAGISYVDTGLLQQNYYYKVQACDSANNCGALSEIVSLYPDGKFIEAAPLVGEPVVSNITTKRATVTWTTGRTADSKVAFGTSSDSYNEEEVGNSSQVTSHTLNLSNLAPGTTYYFVSKWTDEDGNMGISEEATFETAPAPAAKEVKAVSVGLSSATIQFTSKNANSARIYFGKSADFGGVKDLSVGTNESTYDVSLTELSDGTKYYFKVNLFDIEGEEYEGDVYSFETLPQPKVGEVVIQQIKGAAQPTIFLVWNSNTEVSSVVTYYPKDNPSYSKDEVNIALESGRHRMVITDLMPETTYGIIVSGRDKAGNEARSDEIIFKTSTDTRPPMISSLKIEGSLMKSTGGSSEANLAQLVVSWKTDEPSTSQIEFGEGSGSAYAQKTQEDVNLTMNHLVVISNLTPSKVYHLRAISKDKVENEGYSIDNVTITPKATDDALDLVISNLSEVFSFVGDLNK